MRTWLRKGLLAAVLLGWLCLGSRLHAAEGTPLSLDSILKLKAAEITDDEIGQLIDKRGVGFAFNAEVADKLITGGCGTELIKKIRAAASKDAKSEAPKPPANPAPAIHQPGDDDTGLMPGMADDGPPATPTPAPTTQAPGVDGDDPLPPVNGKVPAADDDDPLPPLQPAQADTKPAPPVKPAPKAPPPNPFKKANPIDELDKTTEPAPELIYGPRVAEAKQKGIEAGFQEILKASGLPLQITASKHVTLIASAANAQKYLPDMKVLEQKLEQRFPGTIKTGPDKRSAIIILVDTQADYKTWITAEFKAFGLDKDNGEAGGGGANPLQMALNARGNFFPFVGVTDLSAFNNDQDRKKSVAYSVGYLYMHALTEGHSPDCFITGFGNYCESLMYTDPMTRVYSYEERTIAAGPRQTWVNQMKDAISQKKASNSDDVLGFSTVTMKSMNYVEAWSFVAFLCQKPKEFEGVVTALRDRNGAMKAISAHYKYDQKNLEYYWKTWANSQN